MFIEPYLLRALAPEAKDAKGRRVDLCLTRLGEGSIESTVELAAGISESVAPGLVSETSMGWIAFGHGSRPDEVSALGRTRLDVVQRLAEPFLGAQFHPDGVVGELVASAPPGKRCPTGYFAEKCADDRYRVLGAKERCVATGEVVLSLADLDASLEAQPGVLESYSLLLEPMERPTIVTFVQASPESLASLRARRLPGEAYGVLHRVVPVPAIPRLANGAVLADDLGRLVGAGLL